MSDPTARTLSLLALLQTHRHWAGAELAERLGVSERTVRRDVDRLRELGYPVAASPGVDGGYQLAAGTHLPPLVVDDDEAVALTVGLRAAAGAAVEGIEETTVRVMAKLEQILPDRLRRRVDALDGSVDVIRWAPRTPVRSHDLTVLAQACRDREEVRFDYVRRDGEPTRRLVRPARLVSVGHRWYLVAFDVRRDDWRTFRVDRMTDPELAGGRFAPLEIPGGSATELVSEGMRRATQTHEALVEVVGPAERIEAVAHWFGGQMTVHESTTRMRVTADSLEWLAAMIAILATSFPVAVLDAPDEVRRLIATAAMRLAASDGSSVDTT